VSEAASVEAAAEKILQEAGRVDILVNNAGITKDGLLMRMSEADWDAVLDINLKGAFLFTKAFSRAILKAEARPHRQHRLRHRPDRQRRPVQLRGQQGRRHRLHQVVRAEFASRGITVNAIAPGFIQTDMTDKLKEEKKTAMLKQIPLASLGQAEDMAEAALFFASPAARYVTGRFWRWTAGW
jgi:3-oxoacyl-[acyl-carrier protein] reductase